MGDWDSGLCIPGAESCWVLLVACCLLSRSFPIHRVHKSDFFKDCNKYLSNLNFYQHARLINVQTFSDESIKLQEYGDRIPKDLLLKLVTRQIFSLCRNAGMEYLANESLIFI